jgi:hypothetical protein
VTGVVRLKLYKGNIIVAGRKSRRSLYDPKIATMEGDVSTYDQSDATGFIRLNALRLKLRAANDGAVYPNRHRAVEMPPFGRASTSSRASTMSALN